MRNRDNEKLAIQTAEGLRIVVTRDEFPYEDNDEGDSDLHYSISESPYWSDCWHKEFESIIAILEMPPRDLAVRRDYISWWLNCRPYYVDESVAGYLKKRLQLYHKMGEIEKAFRYSRCGLESNPDCLLLWHNLLGVQFDPKLLNLLPNDTRGYVEVPTIIVMFDGFNNLPYMSFSLRLFPQARFQHILDYIYSCIKSSVNALSYGNEWILVNLRSGHIIKKEINPTFKMDTRSLDTVGIKKGDKLICKLA